MYIEETAKSMSSNLVISSRLNELEMARVRKYCGENNCNASFLIKKALFGDDLDSLEKGIEPNSESSA